MLGKDSVRASQRVDYSGYEDDDEDNIVYEDNVIPHKELPPLQVSCAPSIIHLLAVTSCEYFHIAAQCSEGGRYPGGRYSP